MKNVGELWVVRGDRMIEIQDSGSFSNLDKWLAKVTNINIGPEVDKVGDQIISGLKPVTPVDSGLTQNSWTKTVETTNGSTTLYVGNTSEDGYNVVQGLRKGHGTGTGGWVPPNDFVSPVIGPILDNSTKLIVRKVIE